MHSFLRDSLQLQHSTNLNIQRSQSTSRFGGASNTNIGADDVYSHVDSVPNYDHNNIPASTSASASASASDSNYIFSATTDNEIDINWCPQFNRPPPFAPSALYKDPNYNQITTMTDSESNQCSSDYHNSSIIGDNSNSLENTRTQYNTNETFSTAMSINDQNQERNPHSSTTMERGSIDTQPKSITSEFESIPSIENKDCEYLKLVMTFKRTLVLPDVFFSYDMAICYCTLCLSNSGRNLLEGRNESSTDVIVSKF